jgi:hypothetical protein
MTTKFRTIQSKLRSMNRPKRRYEMQTGAIVRLNAGCFIPNEYLELVLKANPTAWGAAAIVEEDGVKKLMTTSGDDTIDIEFMQTAMKEYNKFGMTWYFCNNDASINMADVPPYILIGTGEEPLLVGFVEGNFPGYVNKDSSHPAEHFFTDKYLIPKLEGIADMVDQDFDKFLLQLEKPLFKTEVLKDVVSRGTITLVANTGASFNYSIGDTSAEYKWGWVSNNYDYAKAKAPEPKAAEPEKKKLFPNKSTVREHKDAQPNAKIADAVAAPKSEGATVLHNITVKKWKPAGNLSRKDRKDAYQQMIGYAPPGWEKDVPVEVYYGPDNKLMTFAQVKRLGLEAAKLPKLNNPRHKGDNRDNKDTDAHIIEASGEVDHVTNKKVTAEILPIMPPKSREFAKNILADVKVQKKIAENAVAIMDPNKMGMFEVKHPDFPAQLGMKSIDDFTMIEYEEFLRLSEDKHVAANLMFTFRNIIVGQRAKLGKHAQKVEAAPPTTETPTVAPVTEKKSLFPKKAAA